MRMWTGLLAILMLALVPAAATAGGFATVGLESPPPERTSAGEPWTAEFTVLAHGRTPLDDLRPEVILEGADGAAAGRFAAVAGNDPGSYRADVDFPDSGRFRVLIDDGYTQRHSFSTVTVGDGAATDTANSPPLAGALALSVAAGLLCALLVAWLGRRRTLRSGTAPVS